MPRRRQPARLYQRPDTGDWIIRDGARTIRTGARGECGRDAAETALRQYLASRLPERTGPADPAEITCGEILSAYAMEHGPNVASPATLGYSIKALAAYWGGLTADKVKGNTCRA